MLKKILYFLFGNPHRELNRHLTDIAEQIVIDDDEREENVEIVNRCMDELVFAMKKVDPLFSELNQRIGYSGSYYQGLRICDPCEFDLNIILRLPFQTEDVEMTASRDPADYVQLKLCRDLNGIFKDQPLWNRQMCRRFASFFREDYLMCDSFQKWVQSMMDKAMKRFRKPPSVQKVEYHGSGPGCTLKIIKLDGVVIDVDVAVVIDGNNLREFPPEFDQTYRFEQLIAEHRFYYLVPKMGKPREDAEETGKLLLLFMIALLFYSYNVTVGLFIILIVLGCSNKTDPDSRHKHAARNWRVSFPEADKKLIHGMNAVKPLIKLIKLLRDKQSWPYITSYQIVTVFLWEMDNRSSPYDWNEKDLGGLYLEMLEKLQSRVKCQTLLYYYAHKANLFDKMKPATAENTANRLKKIINDIKMNPQNVLKYY